MAVNQDRGAGRRAVADIGVAARAVRFADSKAQAVAIIWDIDLI